MDDEHDEHDETTAADDGCAAHEATGHHGYAKDRQPLHNRLRRIEGQVRGIDRMIDEDAYCIDVITQVSAVKSALDRVAMLLLEDHLGHCVAGAVHSSDEHELEAKIAEATEAIARLIKA